MEIRHLNELCNSNLVQTLDKRFNFVTQRSISLKADGLRAMQKGIIASILLAAYFIVPAPEGDPRYLVGRILLIIIILIQSAGVISYVRKYLSFGKQRTLDEIQAYYSSLFLQTTDKYKTTPRDRNRSIKKALLDNSYLFPYPLVNYFTKDGYKAFLFEWNEILRRYPLWKIDICALRLMFINTKIRDIRFIKIEIDYRIDEQLKTFALYNAIIELKGVLFLISPFPYSDE